MTATSKKGTTKAPANELPPGFDPAGPAKGAWVVVQAGNTVQGVYLGTFKNKMGAYYQVRATAPGTLCTRINEGEAEACACAVGDILNLNSKAQLASLADMVPGEDTVYVRYLDKQAIDGGKSVWNILVGKGRKG